jgi:hypothetical protein
MKNSFPCTCGHVKFVHLKDSNHNVCHGCLSSLAAIADRTDMSKGIPANMDFSSYKHIFKGDNLKYLESLSEK